MKNKFIKDCSIIGFLVILVICRQYLSIAKPGGISLSANSNDFESRLALGQKVNLDHLKQYQLERLPSLGSKLAQGILKLKSNQPICTQADLTQISGIGRVKAEKLIEQLDLASCGIRAGSHENLQTVYSNESPDRFHPDNH